MSNLINRSNSLSRISICAFYLVTVSFLLLANLDTLKGVTYEGRLQELSATRLLN